MNIFVYRGLVGILICHVCRWFAFDLYRESIITSNSSACSGLASSFQLWEDALPPLHDIPGLPDLWCSQVPGITHIDIDGTASVADPFGLYMSY